MKPTILFREKDTKESVDPHALVINSCYEVYRIWHDYDTNETYAMREPTIEPVFIFGVPELKEELCARGVTP